MQMSNGCICCTIRDDLHETLQLLAAKKRKAWLDFERGDRDHRPGRPRPGGGADLLHGRRDRRDPPTLDSIGITLVDAKHAAQQLNDRRKHAPVGFG